MEINILANVEMGRKECVEVLDVYEDLLEAKKYPLLHVVNEYVIIDKEAREFGSSEAGLKFSKAEAFVINSFPHKLLANFYLKVNKPQVPTRFFENKQDAINWLNQFL